MVGGIDCESARRQGALSPPTSSSTSLIHPSHVSIRSPRMELSKTPRCGALGRHL